MCLATPNPHSNGFLRGFQNVLRIGRTKETAFAPTIRANPMANRRVPRPIYRTQVQSSNNFTTPITRRWIFLRHLCRTGANGPSNAMCIGRVLVTNRAATRPISINIAQTIERCARITYDSLLQRYADGTPRVQMCATLPDA